MESELGEILLELAFCAVLPYALIAAIDRAKGRLTVHPDPGTHHNGEPFP